MARSLVEIDKVVKQFQMGDTLVEALRGVSLTIDSGEYLAIMGPSGSGKSTMMNIIGGLDWPTRGRYRLEGEDISTLDDTRLSEIRGTKIGFVFQSFNLIGQLSVVENIEVPMVYHGVGAKECRERAKALAERVGLGHRCGHIPRELSGGEQQRVAIARALANDPSIILADEPTGNLDSKRGAEILEILNDLHEEGKTLIMVTHDPEMTKLVERVVHFRDGLIEREVAGGKPKATAQL